MSQAKNVLQTVKVRTIPDTALRRLRITPGYFFLVWRWSMWLYALVVIIWSRPSYQATPRILPYASIATLLLAITFTQALIVTLYAPVVQMFFPYWSRKSAALATGKQKRTQQHVQEDEDEPEIVPPITRTRHVIWDVAIYTLDVLICGLVMYYSAAFAAPWFGSGSPFYRYGLSTVFAAALAYRYRGGLAAAIGYDLFAVLGIVIHAPGVSYYPPTATDIVGSLVDAPVAALLAAFLATLIANYAQSKRREQSNARIQQSLVRIGETLMKSAHNRQELLQRSAQQILQGGHFQRLTIALVEQPGDETEHTERPVIGMCVEATADQEDLPERQQGYLERVLQTGKKLVTFERLAHKQSSSYGEARFYLPLPQDDTIQIVVGAESRRTTPFDEGKEKFLTIAGDQLLIALDNMRLTEQMVELAATTERDRIAREIHDGIAQLIYMLSLHAETCVTQAQRIAEASEEDAELITPLATRLDKMVTVSKQALWETRNYMFSLKPLMSGTTTLTQMIRHQLREFETISDLPVQLGVEGTEESVDDDRRRSHRYAQVGAALFRIVQEALSNAYKHAEATQLQVILYFRKESIEVSIRDNGRGLHVVQHDGMLPTHEEQVRIYSGHGVRGMQARARELGGTCTLLPATTGGLEVRACIPI